MKLSEGTQPTLLDVSLSAHLRAASCIRRTVIAAQRVRRTPGPFGEPAGADWYL